MTIRSAREMLREANAAVETLSVEQALGLVGDGGVVLVDVRETLELQQQGRIAGAVHVPRGLLEFQADPEMPMHNPALQPDKRLVLYCGSGGRSALAAKTLKEMGYPNVAHIAGGFGAWTAAGGPTEA